MMIPSPIWAPTNTEYHGDRTRWSSSMLKAFRSSPALAYDRFVLGREEELGERNKSLILGSAVNAELLGVGEVNRVDVKSAAAKAYKDAVVMNPSATVVTAPEYEIIMGICDSVREPRTEHAELAKALLIDGEGYSEWAHRWTDKESGIQCKSMIDRLTTVNGTPAVVELKTTVDPSPSGFSRQAHKFEYHAQAGHNVNAVIDALAACFTDGEYNGEVMFFTVAIRNSRPYEVVVYEGSADYIERGKDLTRETLSSIMARMGTDTRWCADWESFEDGEIPQLELPSWA